MNNRKWLTSSLCCLLTSTLLVGCIGFIDSSDADSDDTNDNGTGTSLSSDGVLCDYFESEFNDSPSIELDSTSEWTCTTTRRLLSANGIPRHGVGEFPSDENPNTITEQVISSSITLTPTESTLTTNVVTPGYMLNGVRLDADTQGSCNDEGECDLTDNTRNWDIEVLAQSVFDFGVDSNTGDVDSSGSYHYHGFPDGLVTILEGDSSSMTLIGWAVDGFPIYARYGFDDADDEDSTVRLMSSSYELISESDVSSTRPSLEDFPLGTFEQDWEYVEGSGDLDECNGRDGVTPEFPTGIYHYFATDTYPFVQRCINGNL